MTTSTWLLGLIPLIAFAIIDSFFGLKKGLIAALVLAIIEAIWSYYTFHELDQISILSLGLIIIFGVIAWKTQKSIFFKLWPSLVSLAISLWLLVSYVNDQALFVAIALKYAHLLPIHVQDALNHPPYLAFLARSTLTTGVALLLHAVVTTWAAFKLSTWWWLAIRGIGFYLFCFIAMLIAQYS